MNKKMLYLQINNNKIKQFNNKNNNYLKTYTIT